MTRREFRDECRKRTPEMLRRLVDIAMDPNAEPANREEAARVIERTASRMLAEEGVSPELRALACHVLGSVREQHRAHCLAVYGRDPYAKRGE